MYTQYQYGEGLETERLQTRFLKEEDKHWWAAYFESAEATRFNTFFIDDTSEVRALHMIEKQIQRYAENRFGLQVLINKENGEPVGLCGLLLQEVDEKMEMEIGYHLLPAQWGKGYASESAIRFKKYAFENTDTDSIISVIDVMNFRSQGVAQRNGMTREKQIKYLDHDVYIYRILRS